MLRRILNFFGFRRSPPLPVVGIDCDWEMVQFQFDMDWYSDKPSIDISVTHHDRSKNPAV